MMKLSVFLQVIVNVCNLIKNVTEEEDIFQVIKINSDVSDPTVWFIFQSCVIGVIISNRKLGVQALPN